MANVLNIANVKYLIWPMWSYCHCAPSLTEHNRLRASPLIYLIDIKHHTLSIYFYLSLNAHQMSIFKINTNISNKVWASHQTPSLCLLLGSMLCRNMNLIYEDNIIRDNINIFLPVNFAWSHISFDKRHRENSSL